MCGNCGKRLPFSIGMAHEKSREGRKKSEPDDGEEEEEYEEEEEDREMSDPFDEKHVKTRNRKCVCCDKPIKGGRCLFPKIVEEDDRSGKPCCRGCRTNACANANKY